MNAFRIALGILTAGLVAGTSHAAVIYGDVADGEILSNGSTTTTGTTARVNKPGGANDPNRYNAVFVFDLAGVAQITDATFGAFLVNNDVNIPITADLFGVGYGSTADGWTTTVPYSQSGTPGPGEVSIEDPFAVRNDIGLAEGDESTRRPATRH